MRNGEKTQLEVFREHRLYKMANGECAKCISNPLCALIKTELDVVMMDTNPLAFGVVKVLRGEMERSAFEQLLRDMHTAKVSERVLA